MRPPLPEAMLVDHPVLTMGCCNPARDDGEVRPSTRKRRMSLEARLNVAVQLTACSSILGEFGLWPGRSNLLKTRIVRGDHGVRALIDGSPMALDRTSRRLGGGANAARRLREAVQEAVCTAAGLPDRWRHRRPLEPGYFVESWLQRLLEALPRPLNPYTARSLWGIRWDLPATPEEGEAVMLSVPHRETSCRLASALWSSLNREQRSAWMVITGDGDYPTAPLPPIGSRGVLIVGGAIGGSEIEALRRWVDRPGCAAVAVGGFPRGWNPPPPEFPQKHLWHRLVIAGMPLDRCRYEVERRSGSFRPLVSADREALTRGAAVLFASSGQQSPTIGGATADTNAVGAFLELLPDGIPDELLVLHGGIAPEDVERLATTAGAVRSGRRWRLPDPVPLRSHPRHAIIADLFPASDPCHFRHMALGGAGSDDLQRWAQQRLNDLDGPSVRDVLEPVARGEIGTEIEELLLEACLSELDFDGARRVAKGLSQTTLDPWEAWIEAVDPPPGRQIEAPSLDAAIRRPRPWMEVALVGLYLALNNRSPGAAEFRRVIAECSACLSGALKRLFELRLAEIDAPFRLADRAWRASIIDGHSVLKRRLCHLRGLQLCNEGVFRGARRFLKLARIGDLSPARLGLIELDLGSCCLGEGRDREADVHHLRALRLMGASGFVHRTRVALFNLAVADLDRLDVTKAKRRLQSSIMSPGDPFVATELTRVALAEGQLDKFERLNSDLEDRGLDTDPRFREALAFLAGARATLDRDWDRAAERLQEGGEEGRAWLNLVTVARGRVLGAEVMPVDGWGVSEACHRIQHDDAGRRSPDGCPVDEPEDLSLQQSFGVALAEKLLGRAPAGVTSPTRHKAKGVLRQHGLLGWADFLATSAQATDGLIFAVLARLTDGIGLHQLEPQEVDALFEAIGVTGLEVRSLVEDEVIWSAGRGKPGAAAHSGHLSLVPLGVENADGPVWRLVGRLMEPSPLVLAGNVDDERECGICGKSREIQQHRRELRKFAPSRLPVTLLGETGVGKEVAARAMHRMSARRGRFVAVNIAAIPSSLLESELFGSVRGAYTGADRPRQGLVDAADCGTLFLDEIGDLDLPLQVKLLRFLEAQEVRPVGATADHAVDVRIIAATHCDLERLVEEGVFRQDLYYRIALAKVKVPPLRDRVRDIPLLRELFERQAIARDGLRRARWSSQSVTAMMSYAWPGNVRELKHVVEVAMLRVDGGVVTGDHLPISGEATRLPGTWEEELARFRRSLIEQTLARTGGNRTAAARELDISRQTLLYHMRALGVRG